MKAAVLYKIDNQIDCDRINLREQIEDIIDDPDNLQYKEYSDESSLFFLIHSTLGESKLGITACNIFENIDTVYVGYYIDITEVMAQEPIQNKSDEKTIQKPNQNVKINIFASQLTSQHVTGNLIIVKYKLIYDVANNNIKTKTIAETLTQYELLNIFESIFIKEGVVINSSGCISQYRYIMNPLEHLMLSDPRYAEHYVYHEYEIYTHIMIIIADVREMHGSINKIGSLLAGNPVNGTIFIAMYKKPEFSELPPYVGISINQLKLIISLRQRSTTLTTGMTRSDKEYVNFEKLLELENKKHFDKPLLELNDITGELLNTTKKKSSSE